jgi:general L-amino acid transport system permease protein
MTTTTGRPPPWRDVRYLAWAFQLAVVGAVVVFVLWIRNNLKQRNFRIRYEYLDERSGIPITGSDFRQTQPVGDAIIEGLANTARLVVAGVVLATVLGTLIGIFRLSQNLILRTAAQWYVEVVRNVPLIAIFIIMYSGVALNYLPNPRLSLDWTPIAVANTRGVSTAWYRADPSRYRFGGLYTFDATANWKFAMMVAAVIAAVMAVRWWRLRVGERRGGTGQAGAFSVIAALIVIVGLWVAFGFRLTTPELDGLRTSGGIEMTIPFFAALSALVLYTASHVAEIVRGSIQAVAKGQGEAADALALSGSQRLRFVVLPQAMRIALPPIGNQYLNLAKNSSLAAVVTFPELTKITQLLISASTVPPVASLLLLLGIYLCISLVLSIFVNLLNRRLRIVER